MGALGNRKAIFPRDDAPSALGLFSLLEGTSSIPQISKDDAPSALGTKDMAFAYAR